jgi:hypothetical protein
MKIGALPEIVIGEMPIGAVRNEEQEKNGVAGSGLGTRKNDESRGH